MDEVYDHFSYRQVQLTCWLTCMHAHTSDLHVPAYRCYGCVGFKALPHPPLLLSGHVHIMVCIHLVFFMFLCVSWAEASG